MNDETRARELFGPMREIPVDLEGRRFKVDRDKIVASILDAPATFAAERAARRRRMAVLWSVAAGVALAAGAMAAVRGRRAAEVPSANRTLQLHDVRGTVSLVDGASEKAVLSGRLSPVSPEGDLVTGPASEASIHTPEGLEIQLFESSRVALSDLREPSSSETVHLERGSVRCQVPRLASGRQFSVVTPSATVVVHGTTFRVAVAAMAGATRTCVRVEEGVVSVIGAGTETRVEASQSWGCDVASSGPADVAPSPAVEATSKSAPPSVRPGSNGGHAPASRGGAESQRPLRGTLQEENQLFQAGLASERIGDTRRAATSFELLLSRYPQSPLADEARAALTRVANGNKGAP